ncbi:MAG: hypothetical protein GC156_13100 [Actinomycetales bacterium]|nr:hypothetical protein [Actinomycetales bacterium]
MTGWMRRVLVTAVTLAAMAAGGMALAVTASAHAELVGSSPADGEVLDAAPDAVTLSFSERLVEMGAAITVRGADKQSITTGPLAIDGFDMTVPVDPNAVPGTYTVAFRVVSEDGHTVTSTFQYSVAGQLPPAASPEPTAPVSVEPAAPQTAPLSAEPTPPAAEAPVESSGISPVVLVIGGAVIVGLVIVGAIALRR